MYLKKWIVCLLSLLLITGCTQKKVALPKPVTIEFYSVKTCSECIAFKKNAIPYLKTVSYTHLTLPTICSV